jgi:hypothetical protein
MFAFDENGVCRAYLQFAQGKWYSGSTSGHLHDRTYVQRILCITDESSASPTKRTSHGRYSIAK